LSYLSDTNTNGLFGLTDTQIRSDYICIYIYIYICIYTYISISISNNKSWKFLHSILFPPQNFCLPLGGIAITYVTETSRRKPLSGGRASGTSRRAGAGAAHAQAPGRQAPKREPTTHARVRLPLTCRVRPHLTALSATGRPRRRARHRQSGTPSQSP
jgi:hypothetical protein